MTEHSFSVDEFCTAERICRATLYGLWKKGRGPRYYEIGNRRRITAQARADWHAEREAATATAA